jgi:hypothetical protein
MSKTAGGLLLGPKPHVHEVRSDATTQDNGAGREPSKPIMFSLNAGARCTLLPPMIGSQWAGVVLCVVGTTLLLAW